MTSKEVEPGFEELLAYLKVHRGFDFTGYKRLSLMRRVRRHMQTVSIDDFAAYQDYLEVHPEEFACLFDTILINVTSFFRDPGAWQYLADEILPRIVEARASHEIIRIWSAGTASGEEAYTLAMLMAEALSVDEAQRRVKIYATDVDEKNLARARLGSYTAKEVAPIPDELRDKYLELSGDRYIFSNGLRRAVIFGRHNLTQDAPISRLDLLVCRNTLIYFNSEAQRKILARFHFALRDGGYLFLGRAEMLLTHSHLFSPEPLQHRIFRKIPPATPHDQLLAFARAGNGPIDELDQQMHTLEASLNASPVAQVILDPGGKVILANEQACSLFGLDARDVGRPVQDLELSYRPVELRSMIERAQAEDHEVLHSDTRRHLPDGTEQYLDVRVRPLRQNLRRLLGTAISFEDVTERHRMQHEIETTEQELETAYEELQSTNEELETTNEELQSTVEELQTTNEELQSTNEEMETMNEELLSTNDELREINAELRLRTLGAQQANAFLKSILSSVDVGVVVLNEDLEVLLWNERAEDLWGMRAEEVQGQPFLSLDIGLPVNKLQEPLRVMLDEEKKRDEVTVQARNRRGRQILCKVTQTLRPDVDGDVAGVVMLMEEQQP